MSDGDFSVEFYGGVDSVTGANFLLQGPDFKTLIDCGLFQGNPAAENKNRDRFPYDPKTTQFLIVTHAHADHIGRIPYLVKEGFSGEIYSTPETKKIAEVMFDDAVGLIKMDARKEGILPVYGKEDVAEALKLWKTKLYHEKFDLTPSLSVTFKDAGHILGSAMVECELKNTQSDAVKKIIFTGDLGNSPSALLKDTENPGNIDYLVMESVYGDRNHESKEEREAKFLKIIRETIARGGTLLIPVFSLERTQAIIYELNNLVEKNKIPQTPVFLDSPLAIELTRIYESVTTLYNKKVKEDMKRDSNIFDFPKLKETAKVWDSKKILSAPNPKIILAGSGMSTGGRILHHEKHFLPDPKTTFLVIGFQAPGTLGRQIQDGAKKVEIDGDKIPVRARVETINGYSSHKDSDHLIEFVEKSAETLEKVFVVMGEPKASTFLVQRLRDYLGVNALVPKKGEKYYLDI
jgi:metallo-beta-lactamase family protein